MRRRFGLVMMVLGLLGAHTTGAQLVQPTAVRDHTACHAVWPPPQDGTCLGVRRPRAQPTWGLA